MISGFLHESQVFICANAGIYKMHVLLGKVESVYICSLSTLGGYVCSVAMVPSDLHVLCMLKQALISLANRQIRVVSTSLKASDYWSAMPIFCSLAIIISGISLLTSTIILFKYKL